MGMSSPPFIIRLCSCKFLTFLVCLYLQTDRRKQSGNSYIILPCTQDVHTPHLCTDWSRSLVSKDVATTPTCYLSAARASKRRVGVSCTIPRARSSTPFLTDARALRYCLDTGSGAYFFPSDKTRSDRRARRKWPREKRKERGNRRPERAISSSAYVQRKKKRQITATSLTERPYRRAGSPACTARVYRFSHRRTTTTVPHSPPPSSLFSTFLSVCRDNPLHQPRSTANKRVLPRKSSPLNPTWRHSIRFSLRVPRPRAPQRAAQSASSRPLPSSRVRGKKLSPHDRRLQDEGQDEHCTGQAYTVHAYVDLDYCIIVSHLILRKIIYRVDWVVNEYECSLSVSCSIARMRKEKLTLLHKKDAKKKRESANEKASSFIYLFLNVNFRRKSFLYFFLKINTWIRQI